jgi:hypothetical protein
MNKLYILSFSLLTSTLFAQDDLMKELEQNQKPETNFATQTFKGTRIVNGQSVETKGKGELEFIFSHRFGLLNSGSYNAWGLDGGAMVRLGLEYGITDRLGVSIGRTFYPDNKMADLFVRYKVARQSSGAHGFPFTITALGTVTYQAYPNASQASVADPDRSAIDRMGYVLEVPIARKFSSKFSAQITPIFVHRNAVNKSVNNNDDFALLSAARLKITRSLSLIGEYCARLNTHTSSPYYDAAGIGLDIETGGHVFQLIFTNSLGLNTQTMVTQTDGNIGKGDIHFGFNITRTLQLGKRK